MIHPFFRITLLGVLFLAGCAPSPHDLVARGRFDELKQLISAHPQRIHEIDRKGKTALHTAVGSNKLDMLPWLADHGADLNAQDITGMTPLHVAAMFGRREAAAWLLDHGAKGDIRDTFGDLPMHTAAVFGQGGIIIDLSARGFSLAEKNAAGKTPLELARDNRREKVVALLTRLLKNGISH